MDVQEEPIDNAIILESIFNVSFSDEEPTNEEVQRLTELKRIVDALQLKLKKKTKKGATTIGSNVDVLEFKQKLMKYSSFLIEMNVDIDCGMYFIYILIYIIY